MMEKRTRHAHYERVVLNTSSILETWFVHSDNTATESRRYRSVRPTRSIAAIALLGQ